MSAKMLFLLILTFTPFSHQSSYNFILKWMSLKSNAYINNTFENECASDLKSMISEASDSKLWALKMLDASGKLTAGLLEGNFQLMGNYEECLSINEKVKGRVIQGQYCTIDLAPNNEILDNLNLTSISKLPDNTTNIIKKEQSVYNKVIILKLGICVPKSCSAQDLRNVRKDMIQTLNVKPTFDEDFCYHKGKPIEYNNLDVFAYSFFIILLFLAMAGTTYDVYFRNSALDSNFLVNFSLRNNIKRLLSENSTNDTLSCLNGIRVLSCIWIILGHTVVISFYRSKNLVYIFTQWNTQVQNTVFWTGFFGVDTFFTISGLLVSYVYLNYSEKRPINVLYFYLHRYIRILPAFLATTLISTSVMKTVRNGPYAFSAHRDTFGNCGSWWKVFSFFISETECVRHSWYLTVDTHYYLVAPFILSSLKKNPKLTMTGIFIMIVMAITYSFVATIIFEVGVTGFQYNTRSNEIIQCSNISNLSGWLIGLMFGHLLYHRNFKIPNKINTVLWVFSLLIIVNVITNQVLFVVYEYNVYAAAFWNALSKPLWCLSVCSIIYSCATGNGGFVNSFLSHSTFRVLSKLSYSAYLIHEMVIILVSFTLSYDAIYFSNFQMFSLFLTVLFLVVLFSVPLYLCLEAPIVFLKHRRHNTKEVP